MAIHFISDLHLDITHPQTTHQFLNYLQTKAKDAEALYILGDLFEVWIGDDEASSLHQTIAASLQDLASQGVPIYYLHGNRDFLIGNKFAKKSGITLLADPFILNVYGLRIILTHGDTLCTKDVEYLKARARYRRPAFKILFLMMPLFIRKAITQHLRNVSKKHTRTVSAEIMDTTQSEIEKLMQEHQASILIHGHTHRPAIHHFQLNGKLVTRYVLSDWDKSGNVLTLNQDGTCRLLTL